MTTHIVLPFTSEVARRRLLDVVLEGGDMGIRGFAALFVVAVSIAVLIFLVNRAREPNNTTPEATLNIDRTKAALACKAAAEAAASHPSTVDFSLIRYLEYKPFASGKTRLNSSFTANNSFNLELKYNISCLFDGQTLIETQITEAR